MKVNRTFPLQRDDCQNIEIQVYFSCNIEDT